MDKELLLEKWLKNELTEAEEKVFKQQDGYALNLEILETARQFKASRFSNVADFETFKAQYASQKTPVKKLNRITPLLRIASVVVIAFGIYFSFFFNNNIQVHTLASEKKTLELPDHSQIVLNAVSSLEYNERNWSDNRVLELDGEAFFKVAKGKTFDVITSQGKVTVVGTAFNVKQRDNYFEVHCFEGVVNVNSDTITRQLTAGDTYVISDKKFTVKKSNTMMPEWINNTSVFNAMPIKEVFAELERQYDIEILYNDVNTNRLFTGGFSHKNLKNALISITQPMNMTYELSSSNHVIINGQKK